MSAGRSLEPPMLYDLPALEASLAGSIFAGKLHFAPVTESTNTDALEAARAGAPHGSVYFADEQLAGRGRGGHAWHSAAGQGLYVSVLLRPELPAARFALLPLTAGLAAASAIRSAAGLTADIRWPNDLLIGPCKTGGILVEARIVEAKTVETKIAEAKIAQARSGGGSFAVVGVGINVHQREFPADVSTPATSLQMESPKPVSRQTLLVELLRALEREAALLLDPASVRTIPLRVQQASTWVCGRSVHVHGPQACAGVTAGLDENGFLLVRTASGMVTVQTGGLRAAEP